MNLFVLFGVIIGLTSSSYGAKSIPKFITLCKRNDPNLNSCYQQQLSNVLKHLDNGLPEMNLRKVDPLLIEKLNLDFGTGSSVSFKADLTNMKLYGLNQVVPTAASLDLDNNIIELKFKVPLMRMESHYKAKGRVLLLEFDSEGPFWGNFTGLECVGKWTGERFMKKGKEHLRLEKGDVDISMKDIKMYFSNLFPNNDEITTTTNQAINENIDLLYQEIKPLVIETFNAVVIDASNNVFKLFSIDHLFPKD